MANDYVEAVHRHHPRYPQFGMFAVAAVTEEGEIRGVAIVAMPNAANRLTDGFRTAEVVRVATDGTPNACSILYAACARATKALGFSRIISYTLDSETGLSIAAAGWIKDEGVFGNQSWENHTKRPGTGHNTGPKGRWSKSFAPLDRPDLHFPEGLIEEEDERTLDLFSQAGGLGEKTTAHQS